MHDEGNIRPFSDLGNHLQIELRFYFVDTVRRSERDCQSVHACLFKVFFYEFGIRI